MNQATVKRLSQISLMIMGIPVLAGCAESRPPLVLTPAGRTSEVLIDVPAPIGKLRLWVPEGIMSEVGGNSIYPVGDEWVLEKDGAWVQHVEPAGNFGPGNFRQVDERTLELEGVGIRFPKDGPVRWRTRLTSTADTVHFTLQVRNAGQATIRKAGAALCLKFLEAPWWSDDRVFVSSGGAVRALSELGPNAGPDNGFEAYLLAGQRFDNVFYREFWGFNRHSLDRPMMVAEHPEAGLCVGIEGAAAYFLHSNRRNPCTDIMLAFGDITPGQTAEAAGSVWIRRGKASDWLRQGVGK